MEIFKHTSLTTKSQKVYKSTQRFYDATSYLQENGLIKTSLIKHHTFEYSLTLRGEVIALSLYSFKESQQAFNEIIKKSSDEGRKLYLMVASDILGIKRVV